MLDAYNSGCHVVKPWLVFAIIVNSINNIHSVIPLTGSRRGSRTEALL